MMTTLLKPIVVFWSPLCPLSPHAPPVRFTLRFIFFLLFILLLFVAGHPGSATTWSLCTASTCSPSPPSRRSCCSTTSWNRSGPFCARRMTTATPVGAGRFQHVSVFCLFVFLSSGHVVALSAQQRQKQQQQKATIIRRTTTVLRILILIPGTK